MVKVKEKNKNTDLKLNIQKTKVMTFHHCMANRWRKKWKQRQISFSWAPKSLRMMTAVMEFRDTMTNLDNMLKSRNITLQTKFHIVKLWFFP